MISLTQRPAQTITIRGQRTALVQVISAGPLLRIVQTVSPVPTGADTVRYLDGGDF